MRDNELFNLDTCILIYVGLNVVLNYLTTYAFVMHVCHSEEFFPM